MTNEKAIMCLEDMKIKVPIPKAAKQARENNEALDVAIKALKNEPHWHPVSEQPQEEDDYLLLTHEKFKHGTFKRIIIGAWNSATKEWLEEYGDMYRTVNHPVAWISKEELLLLKGYGVTE